MRFILAASSIAVLCSQTSALYLCLFQADVTFAVGEAIFEEPACFARAVSSSSDCNAAAGDGAVVGNHCSGAIKDHTRQGGGFWIENHNINYMKHGVHYNCDPGNCPSIGIGKDCGCDAGDGVPA